MTQDPKQGCLAAMATRQPGNEVGPLRPAGLKPYQEAMFECLQDSTSTKQVTLQRADVDRTPLLFTSEELDIFGLSIEDLPRHAVVVEDLFEVPPMPMVEFKGVFGKGGAA